MNKHIEIVKKWIADKNSVDDKELIANRQSAYDANAAATYAAFHAAHAAAAASAVDADDTQAVYWVKKYESLVR
tara:strand:- start:729 stop:950 length:222 start_codon:yes stop_codon:yes gene_type:complete